MDVEAKSAIATDPHLRRVLQNSTFYLMGNIASRILGFIAIPFYSHFLTPAQYGIIELIELSTQVIAIAFGLQSIGAALTRLFHDQETPEQENNIVSTSVLTTGLLSGIIAAAAVLAAGPISLVVFHSANEAPLLQAAFIAMWFANMVEVILVYQRIRERARFFFIYSMVGLITNICFNVYFIGFADAGVWGFVYSKLIVTGIGSLFLLTLVFREVGFRWRREYLPQFVHFGLPLCLASLSAFAIHFSDRFFLTGAVSLSELGKYALAYRFALLVSILVGESFGNSWNVTFYRFAKQDGWKNRFARVAAYLIFALFLAALAIALMAPQLLRIMVPKSFYPPYLLLPILVLAYAFRECGDFFRNLLLINKRSGTVGKVVFGGAILNAALNFAMIPTFGIYGAAYATIGTWFAYMILFWVLAWREHQVPVSVISFIKIVALTLGIFMLADQLRIASPIPQILIDFLWIGVFIVACLMFYFSTDERAELLSASWAQARRLLNRYQPPGTAQTSDLPAILMLAFYFPPENAIGAARPARFTKYLSRLGYPVANISRWLENSSNSAAIRVPVPSQRCDSTSGFSRLLKTFNQVALPYDDRLWWIPPAYKAASDLIRRNPSQVIFSTHPPVATHLVALALKFRYGTPWIADFRDPLKGNPVRSARRSKVIDTITERWIFKHADAVIANTDAVKQIWQERYPLWKHKIHLIWNGFDQDDVITPRPNNTQDRRIIAHVGTIYGRRSAQPLIECLDRLLTAQKLAPDDFQLRLIGPIENQSLDSSNAAYQRLEKLGCLHVDNRMAPQAEAREEMLKADILVLIDIVGSDSLAVTLPAKAFDYIRACRPILAFTPRNSVITRVLANAGVPNTCLQVSAPIDENDNAVLALIKAPRTETQPSPTVWHDFDSASQTYVLANIISKISAYPAVPPQPTVRA